MIRDDQAVQTEWESTRSGEPIDFPSVLFGKLAVLLFAPLESKERHRHLQDFTSLLSPWRDASFDEDIGKIPIHHATQRCQNGEDMHQDAWLEAIMRLLKRKGFLGETWVRG